MTVVTSRKEVATFTARSLQEGSMLLRWCTLANQATRVYLEKRPVGAEGEEGGGSDDDDDVGGGQGGSSIGRERGRSEEREGNTEQRHSG